MNKIKKIIFIVLIFFLILSIIQIDVQARYSIKNLTGTGLTDADAKLVGNKAITIVTTIGIVLSVIFLIILGLKYMLGSVEEKAEYKKSLMPYIIGCIFVFAASTIATVFYNVMTNL